MFRQQACKTPMKAIKEDDRILDEIRSRTDSHVTGTGLTQAVLEAGHRPQSPGPVTSALGGPWPFFPAPTETRASTVLSTGRAPRQTRAELSGKKHPEDNAENDAGRAASRAVGPTRSCPALGQPWPGTSPLLRPQLHYFCRKCENSSH